MRLEPNKNHQLQGLISFTPSTLPHQPFIMSSHPGKEKYYVKLMSLGYKIITLQYHGKLPLRLLREPCLMYFLKYGGHLLLFLPSIYFSFSWQQCLHFPWNKGSKESIAECRVASILCTHLKSWQDQQKANNPIKE